MQFFWQPQFPTTEYQRFTELEIIRNELRRKEKFMLRTFPDPSKDLKQCRLVRVKRASPVSFDIDSSITPPLEFGTPASRKPFFAGNR
jgi:hypothetical protein